MLIGRSASAVLLGSFLLGLFWSLLQIKRLASNKEIPPLIKKTVCLMFFYTYFILAISLFVQIYVIGAPVIKWDSFESLSPIFTIFFSTILCVLATNQIIKGSRIQLLLSSFSLLWGIVSLYLVFVWLRSRPSLYGTATIFSPFFAFNYFITGLVFLILSLTQTAREHRLKCVGNKVPINRTLLLCFILLHAQLVFLTLRGLLSSSFSNVLMGFAGLLLMASFLWIPVLLGLRWGDPFALLIFRLWTVLYLGFAFLIEIKQLLTMPSPEVSISQILLVMTYAFVLWLSFSSSVRSWKKQLKPAY
jgi:hypothetical protein